MIYRKLNKMVMFGVKVFAKSELSAQCQVVYVVTTSQVLVGLFSCSEWYFVLG